MRKILVFFAVFALTLGLTGPARAAVSFSVAPASLVPDPITVKASSAPIGLFSFSLSQSDGETLSGINLTVSSNGTTTVSGGDLSALSIYKVNSDGNFNVASDALTGTQGSINIGTATHISAATSTLASGKFFVSFQTGASWSDASPSDSITVTLPADGVLTSATSTPTGTAVTTAGITADTTAPQLSSAVAKNTGGTDAKEAGDSVELTFSESTNKPLISSSTINSFFSVNNSHSFLDSTGAIGAAAWNTAGTILTITLSNTASSSTSTLPSLAVGDVITVSSNPGFTDLAGNLAGGTQSLTGSFAGHVDDGGDEDAKGKCANSLINGRLYKVGSDPTVYLAAACRLKPFRGQAVFKSRGKKFQDIIVLSALPSNVSISQTPVLPVAGTLVKGSDKTVWFVDSHGKKRGFVSAKHFMELGFSFQNMQIISDTDLALIPPGTPVEDNEEHPDGAIIKCSNTATVYQVVGHKKFPFTSPTALSGASQTTTNILIVNCANFKYQQGAAIN